jgi:diguanylate cyclase (GGDEF)-like protein
MEIRHLLRVLRDRWWLVVPTFLVVAGTAAALTLSEAPRYESSSTYVVRVTSGVGEDVLNALGVLSRQTEIAETYAQIGASRTLSEDAAQQLKLTPEQQDSIQLQSQLVPGTNILRLAVRSTNADLARQFCQTIGEKLVAKAAVLVPSFELAQLDDASIPGRPVSPNIPVNIALGLALGAALAVGVGIGAAILIPRARTPAQIEMLDRESSAYSEAYFFLRLRQEMSRSRRTGSAISVALMNVNHSGVLDLADAPVRPEAMRRLAQLIEGHLRPEDVCARLDADVFGLLLPDTPEAEATQIVEGLRSRIAVPAIGLEANGAVLRARPAAGLVEYTGRGLSADELLEQARRALREAQSVPAGKTQPFSLVAADPTA